MQRLGGKRIRVAIDAYTDTSRKFYASGESARSWGERVLASYLAAFAALVFDTDAYEDFDPVTLTAICLPLSEATSLYVDFVGPEIALPSLSH